jgi:MOSC domain-containing protein YiiM
MRTFTALEALWQHAPPPPRGTGTVRLIVQRKGNGIHEVPNRAELTPEFGLHGDRWCTSGTPGPECQITMMNVLVAELITAGEQPLHMPGDNFLVNLDLSSDALPIGTRLRLGTAVVEVTPMPHTGCQKFSARFGQEALRWVNWTEHRTRRLRGINCRVIEAGGVVVGDPISVLPEAGD